MSERNQLQPIFFIWQRLNRHFSWAHFLILFLKKKGEELFFISPGNRSHILTPKFEMLSFPYLRCSCVLSCWTITTRSSHRRCSVKKVFLKFPKISRESTHARVSATLWKKRLWHSCFPVNFVKFSRSPFLQNTSGRLLLYHSLNCKFHFLEK